MAIVKHLSMIGWSSHLIKPWWPSLFRPHLSGGLLRQTIRAGPGGDRAGDKHHLRLRVLHRRQCPRHPGGGLPRALLDPGHHLHLRGEGQWRLLRRRRSQVSRCDIWYLDRLIPILSPLQHFTFVRVKRIWLNSASSAPTAHCSTSSTSCATGGSMWTAPPRSSSTASTTSWTPPGRAPQCQHKGNMTQRLRRLGNPSK